MLCLYVLLCLVVTKKCKYGEIKLCGKKRDILDIRVFVHIKCFRKCAKLEFCAIFLFLNLCRSHHFIIPPNGVKSKNIVKSLIQHAPNLKLICFSSCLAVVFLQSIETRC